MRTARLSLTWQLPLRATCSSSTSTTQESVSPLAARSFGPPYLLGLLNSAARWSLKLVSDRVLPLLNTLSVASHPTPSGSRSPSEGLKALFTLPYSPLCLSSVSYQTPHLLPRRGVRGCLLFIKVKYSYHRTLAIIILTRTFFHQIIAWFALSCPSPLPKWNLMEQAIPDNPL